MTPPAPRPVRDDDGEAVIALICACWREYPSIVVDVDAELAHLRAPASWYASLGGAAWVVEEADGDGLVASVAWVPGDGADAELRMLYVAARARRRGLASSLVGLVEAEARGAGAALVELWSDTRFTDAHRLYERLGYERQQGTRELHDLSDSLEYRYRKPLRDL